MRAGRLDRRITIQRKTLAQSTSGQEVELWNTLVARRWANVSPVSGDERFSAPQYAAKEQVVFSIRWSGEVADLSPLDRIIYPAIDTTVVPQPEIAHRHIYDVVAVHEIGRREGLRVVTFRRADT